MRTGSTRMKADAWASSKVCACPLTSTTSMERQLWTGHARKGKPDARRWWATVARGYNCILWGA